MLNQHQNGFTLVEIMVAMAVGSIIILGAGSLFLTTFQTFQKVDELSRKQETVVFAANMLVNEYRKGDAGYELVSTTDSSEECSIQKSDGEPLVGGIARYSGSCDTGRFVSPDEDVDGYYSFTLDFSRGDEDLETLSFHVMERSKALGSGSSSEPYKVGTGDAIIAGGSMSGVGDDLLQGDSLTSHNLGSHNIPDPRSSPSNNNYTDYIEDFKKLDDVVSTCDAATISSSTASNFYCNGNINNLSVAGLDYKVIVAENGISLEQNDNASVNNLGIVAGGAVNINGNNSSATFSGVLWSAGSSNLSASGVNFKGSVVAGGAVVVNNASSITADWNAWDILTMQGYEFSMEQQFSDLGSPINIAESQ